MQQYQDDFLILWSRDVGNEWSLESHKAEGGVGSRVTLPPLSDWDQLEGFLKKFPDPHDPRRLSEYQHIRTCLPVGMAENPDRYLVGAIFCFFVERMNTLLGTEKFLEDLILEKENICLLADRLTEYFIGIVADYGKLGVDAMFFADDFSSQQSMMLSPNLWREIFKPRYFQVFEEVRRWNMDVWLHSCGNCWLALPDLVDLGVQVLHPLQYGCLNRENVVNEYRNDLCFLPGIDMQYVLPRGNQEDIHNHIEETLALFHESHFLLGMGNTITPETSLENIRCCFQSMSRS